MFFVLACRVLHSNNTLYCLEATNPPFLPFLSTLFNISINKNNKNNINNINNTKYQTSIAMS